MQSNLEEATFGAGCFWHVEADFRCVKGVVDADVCYKNTGHAEVVHLKYDPSQVTYDQLLDRFWRMHNPTTKDRQGMDVGSQYRSVIFYYNEEQKRKAEESLKREQESGRHAGRIVTEIVPAKTFWRAEEYHQRYYEKHGASICRA